MSYVDWHVGMKVVFVGFPDKTRGASSPNGPSLDLGRIYTVREITLVPKGTWFEREDGQPDQTDYEAVYIRIDDSGLVVWAAGFRPVQPRKTDISIDLHRHADQPTGAGMRRAHSNVSMPGAVAVGLFIAAIAFVIFITAGGASSHEFYSTECCDDRDCRPEMFVGEVVETPQGYFIQALNLTIAYADPRVKSSPDGRFHLCLFSSYTPSIGSILSVRCLYAPPRSY